MIKEIVAAVVNQIGLLDAYTYVRRNITKSHIVIVMYHRISPKKDSWSSGSVSPESYERSIEYFYRHYEIIPLKKLAEDISQKNHLPPKGIVLTFDDGYKDNYLYAYPILKKYGIPATMFLTTGPIGTGNLFWWDKVSYVVHHTIADQIDMSEMGYISTKSPLAKTQSSALIVEKLMTMPEEKKQSVIKNLIDSSGVEFPTDLGRELLLSWDEVREMSNNGIEFGAHSVNHPILTKLPLEEAKREIIQSKKDVENNIGKQVFSFCYPNGNFNYEIVKFIKYCGFVCAVSGPIFEVSTFENSPYTLSRMEMVEDFNKFKVMFCGLWGDYRRVIRLGR